MLKQFIGRFQQNTSTEVKATLAYTICNIIQQGFGFLSIPALTRLMSTEEYGLTTVYVSVMSLVIIFTSLQLPHGSFNSAMVKYEDDRGGYVSAVTGLCTVLTLLFFVIYLPLRDFWNDLMDLPTLLVLVMGFEMLFQTTINFWMGRERFEFRYKKIVVITVVQTLLTTGLAIAAVAVAKENDGTIKIVVSAAVVVAIGVILYIANMVQGKQFYNKRYWKYAISFNVPLIPYYLSQMIFSQFDRLMINDICGRSDAAKYGVAYTISISMVIVLNAINNSYTPWLYEKIKTKNLYPNRKVTVGIAVLMATLLLAVIAIGPEIIFVAGGHEYEAAKWIIPPVAMSILFLFYTQIFADVQFYYEAKYALVVGSIISAVVNVILNALFIPRFGFVSAGYTTLLSYIIFAVCNYICMLLVCSKKNVDADYIDVKAMTFVAIVFVVLSLALTALYMYTLLRWIAIGVVAVIMLINYKRILRVVNEYISYYK